MDRPAIVDTLAAITGSWSAAKGHAPDLDEARQIIATALVAGTSPDQIHPAATHLTAPAPAVPPTLEATVSALHPRAAPTVRPFVRSALSTPPSARA